MRWKVVGSSCNATAGWNQRSSNTFARLSRRSLRASFIFSCRGLPWMVERGYTSGSYARVWPVAFDMPPTVGNDIPDAAHWSGMRRGILTEGENVHRESKPRRVMCALSGGGSFRAFEMHHSIACTGTSPFGQTPPTSFLSHRHFTQVETTDGDRLHQAHLDVVASNRCCIFNSCVSKERKKVR